MYQVIKSAKLLNFVGLAAVLVINGCATNPNSANTDTATTTTTVTPVTTTPVADTPAPVVKTAPAVETTVTTTTTTTGKRPATHTVVKGDTPYNIANRYGITVNELETWNNISRSTHNIKLGQELRLYPPK